MINFANANFVTSLTTKNTGSIPLLPEIVFIGRSNVGKSSLINALVTRKNMAYTSGKPGFTKLLNFYNVDNRFYLVDAPGYGYAYKGKRLAGEFDAMMDSYFDNNENLLHIFLLLDPRHKPSKDDLDFINFIQEKEYRLTIVFTKSDKLNQKMKAETLKMYREYFAEAEIGYIFTSSLKKTNITILQDEIKQLLAELI